MKLLALIACICACPIDFPQAPFRFPELTPDIPNADQITELLQQAQDIYAKFQQLQV